MTCFNIVYSIDYSVFIAVIDTISLSKICSNACSCVECDRSSKLELESFFFITSRRLRSLSCDRLRGFTNPADQIFFEPQDAEIIKTR